MLAAAIPRKRLLLCGGTVFVLAHPGTVIAPTFGLALLSRIIAGIGAAMFSPTATGAGGHVEFAPNIEVTRSRSWS